MLMINTENSFFDIYSLFFAGFTPQNAFGDEKISFFFIFWYLFSIASNKDFKKLSSKC